MKLTVLLIVSTVLTIIIIYFLIRLRKMLRDTPGAKSEMSTKELIKNWQAEKGKETAYQDEIRKEAKEAARPEVKKILMEKFKEEEVTRATTNKGVQFKDKLKGGLGIDIDRATSNENIDRMVGRTGNINASGHVEHTNIFDRDKLSGYTQHGEISQNRIKSASGDINFHGVERAVRRDSTYTEPKPEKLRFNKRPPQRP